MLAEASIPFFDEMEPPLFAVVTIHV